MQKVAAASIVSTSSFFFFFLFLETLKCLAMALIFHFNKRVYVKLLGIF